MFRQNTSVICTTLLCCLFLLTACSTSPPPPTVNSTVSASAVATDAGTPTPTNTPTPVPAPTQYKAHVVLQGGGHRPDDLAFDTQGRLLFSDFYNNTVSRLNADGSVTTLLSSINGPEGMVVLQDGTMIVAEQRTNRILSFAPGSQTPTLLRQLPGTPSSASCKDGVDGIAFDSTTNTVIVPDSPTGHVYRMSLDGKTLTLLTSGIVRPVGAYVDPQGTIYVADECGGTVWTIAPGGKTTRIGGFGMPDDVVLDGHGNLLVIDLKPAIHALIRMNLATGKRETLASAGYIEPQGLVIDVHGNIFVSDDYADKIVEYEPA
jgi:DNA-binding beta-propeller fold protein YncE